MRILTLIYQNSWAVEEAVFMQLLDMIERKAAGEDVPDDVVAAIVAERDRRRAAIIAEQRAAAGADVEEEDEGITENRSYNVGAVRVVPVVGVIAPRASMVNGISQPMGTSSGRVALDIMVAADEARCDGILVVPDSPGGAVAGTERVVEAIDYARSKKPVHAYTPGMCASGAYWIAGATERITAPRSAMVGSIGVFQIRDDTSKKLEGRGIKRHVFRSGKYKGVGIEGTPITEEARAKWQGEVDAIHAIFAGDVGRWRRLTDEQLAAVADGRIFTGRDAATLGLVDAIGTFTQAIEAVQAAARNHHPATGPGRLGSGKPPTTGARITMTVAELREKHGAAVAEIEAAAVAKYKAENPTAPTPPAPPKAASFEELSEAFAAKEGGLAFIFECQKEKRSMDAARVAWAAKVEGENAELRKQAAAKGDNPEQPKTPAGASPPVPGFTAREPGAGPSAGEPKDYAAAVKMIETRDKVKRPVAMARAQKEFKPLHATWYDAGMPAIP